MKTTIVSALFHIDDPYLKVRHARYKTWVSHLLSLDVPLVMQTDAHYYDFIHEQRRRHDPEFRQTRLIVNSLGELDCYRKFHESIAQLSATGPVLRGPVWTQPLYVMAIWNKLWLLDEVAGTNPMATEWFCWLDAGGIRHPIPLGIRWPARMDLLNAERFNVFCLQEPRQFPRHQWRQSAAAFNANILGATFVGQRESIGAVAQLFKEIAKACTDEGFIASEQRILDYCYSMRPDMFHVMNAMLTPSRQVSKNAREHWYYKHNFFDHLLSPLTPLTSNFSAR